MLLRVTIFVVCSAIVHGATAEEAIREAREALQSAATEYGDDHPATAMRMRELALAFEQAGYHRQAEYYAAQALAKLEARLGSEDFNLVPVLNVLAEAYAGEQRNSEALPIAMRAVRIGPAAGRYYGTALHNAASLLYRLGRFVESEELFVRALAAMEATLPAGHPYMESTRMALKRVQKGARQTALVR